MPEVNVGVIGLRMGAAHLRNYAGSKDARIAAICDIDEGRLNEIQEQYPSARAFTDYKEMLRMEELQAVSVALPNYLHASVTLDCLQAGLHVLCEKPMAVSVEEAERMKAAAEACGRILMLHFNMRFSPLAFALKALADGGVLGEAYHMVATYTRTDGYPSPGSWFGQKDKSGGGPLIDLGVHVIDLALWLAGHPRPVAATGGSYDLMAREKFASEDAGFDCEDLAAGFIRLEGGATLYVAASWDSHQRQAMESYLRIYGTGGSIFLDGHVMSPDASAVLCRKECGVSTVASIQPVQNHPTCQQEFVDCVRTGKKPSATAEQGVTAQRILNALYESAATGREVSIEGG